MTDSSGIYRYIKKKEFKMFWMMVKRIFNTVAEAMDTVVDGG